jgi:hypothetical protein
MRVIELECAGTILQHSTCDNADRPARHSRRVLSAAPLSMIEKSEDGVEKNLTALTGFVWPFKTARTPWSCVSCLAVRPCFLIGKVD